MVIFLCRGFSGSNCVIFPIPDSRPYLIMKTAVNYITIMKISWNFLNMSSLEGKGELSKQSQKNGAVSGVCSLFPLISTDTTRRVEF